MTLIVSILNCIGPKGVFNSQFSTANQILFCLRTLYFLQSNEFGINIFELFCLFESPNSTFQISNIVPQIKVRMYIIHEINHLANKQNKITKFVKIIDFTILFAYLLSVNPSNISNYNVAECSIT